MSETRNILDTQGNIIGALTMPEGTDESTWTSALTPYATVNPAPTKSPNIPTITLSATNSVSTSSGIASTVNGMTSVPVAGKYLVLFNASISTNGASAAGKFGVYVDGVEISETIRPISCNLTLLGGLVTISLNTIGLGTYTGTEVTLNGTQTVDIRFFSTNGGTIGFGERVMTLMKVS